MYRALLFLFSFLPLSAELLVNNYAGGAIPSGIPAQNMLLKDVLGLAWDPSGEVVYCDTDNNVIRRIKADGTVETIAGTGVGGFSGDGGPARNAMLQSPETPRYDVYGNLYFVDAGNLRIRRIDTNGNIRTVAGDGIPFSQGMDASGPASSISLSGASDIALDRSGNLYFSEHDLYRIRRVTPAGQVEIWAGAAPPYCDSCGNGDGGPATAAILANPGALAVDPAGNLFVLQDSKLIRKITPQGIISTFLPPLTPAAPGPLSLYELNGLAADSQGNIYTMQYTQPGGVGIVRYDASGQPTTVAGGMNASASPDGPALPSTIHPASPYPLAIDARGNIAFLDNFVTPSSSTLEIREVTNQSMLKTLAGATPQAAPDGTPPAKAWFLSPSSIAFDASGNLYVADTGTCQIREVTAAGVLTTFAGTGVCGSGPPSGSAKTADLLSPRSLAVDSHNNVWVAGVYNNLISVYSIAQDGTISSYPIQSPLVIRGGWIAFDSQDRLYVAATGFLLRLLPDLTVQTIIAEQTTPGPAPPGYLSVSGLGTDPSRNVYFTANSGIYRMNDDGTYNKVATIAAGGPSFAVDSSGTIWQFGTMVAVTSSSGTALLGGGLSGDGGPAAAARYNANSFQGTAFSPSGDLYFIDNNRIRFFTGSGPLTPPVISQGGIVNAASYASGAIAPGELVSIFGSNFADAGVSIGVPRNNSLPTVVGRTRVLFNGEPGTITAVTPNQINVFVPNDYRIAPGSAAQVQVQVDATLSAAVSLPVTDSAPGIFSLNASGSGQGAILNDDGTVNSAMHPAAPGSYISVFGTGQGLSSPYLAAGSLALSTPYGAPSDHVSVTIGGVAAQTNYAGDAPTLPSGVFQINALIPEGTAAGNVPVLVSIGTNSSGSQITVAVR